MPPGRRFLARAPGWNLWHSSDEGGGEQSGEPPALFAGELVGRKEPEQCLGSTNSQPARVIEIECREGRAADDGACDDSIARKAIVVSPSVHSWIEETDRAPCCGVLDQHPIRFLQVAPRTRPRQVAKHPPATAGAGHHVLEVKSRALKRLMHPAVFAAPAGAGLNSLLDCVPAHHRGLCPRRRSASERTSESFSLRSTRLSSSSRSCGESWPSLWRSISFWSRRSAFCGKRRALTDSTHLTGAETITGITTALGRVEDRNSVADYSGTGALR